mgnify:FL=1
MWRCHRKGNNSRNVGTIARGVAGMLALATDEGFAIVPIGSSPKCGRDFADYCGQVLLETEVRLRPSIDTYLCSPGEIAFHTDHPEADAVVWHCHIQDEEDGATLLIDGLAAYRALSATDQRELRRLCLDCPTISETRPSHGHPFVDGDAIFFAPWLVPGQLDVRLQSALVGFQNLLSAKSPWCREVRLAPGEALMIDNRRFLHGRRSIPPDSQRWLTRYWIGHRRSA